MPRHGSIAPQSPEVFRWLRPRGLYNAGIALGLSSHGQISRTFKKSRSEQKHSYPLRALIARPSPPPSLLNAFNAASFAPTDISICAELMQSFETFAINFVRRMSQRTPFPPWYVHRPDRRSRRLAAYSAPFSGSQMQVPADTGAPARWEWKPQVGGRHSYRQISENFVSHPPRAHSDLAFVIDMHLNQTLCQQTHDADRIHQNTLALRHYWITPTRYTSGVPPISP